MTKRMILASFAVLGIGAVALLHQETGGAMENSDERLVAIDILLQPDQAMIDQASAVNTRLRENYPDGYTLDATHVPHVTLLQRFVRARDLDAVEAAITNVVSRKRPTDVRLQVTGIDYVLWAGSAVTAFAIERTPELMRLHQKVIDAVEPFSVSGGTAGAFAGSGINRETIAYVESFVPKASGPNYVPHVTVGVAKEDFVKRLKAERFKAFTAKVDGVAIYQLGNFGTAAKKLWEHRAVDPLASWNDGAAKRSILDFIRRVTTEGGPDFVPVPERIAVFDNDGTLWAEQPMYFQVYFVLDRIKKLAPQHPEWKTTEPFASVLRGDLNSALAGGDRALLEMVLATHAGMTSDDFEELVTDWIATARHPSTGQPFTKMVYAPMLELLTTLRANGFTVFIVSGGGIEFVRTFSERIYGISRDRVVGSSIVTKYEMRDGSPVLVRRPEVHFIDDKAGKPVGIQQHVGRRPIAAFGNSDGDFEMLEWVTGGGGLRLGLLIHHDDGVREFAYDRNSSVGRLARALDEAPKRDWTVVSMKNDWNKVFTLPDP